MPSSSSSLRRGSGQLNPGRARIALPQDLPAGFALGVALLEVLLLRTRGRHDLEGGVGDVVADLVVDGDFGAPVHLHVLDETVVLRRQVLDEGVRRLVHVVVRIEHREVKDS